MSDQDEDERVQPRLWQQPTKPTGYAGTLTTYTPDWGTSNTELAEKARIELAQELELRRRARERAKVVVRETRREQGLPEQLTIEMWSTTNDDT